MTSVGAELSADPIEVRVLGPLSVRRPDGSLVDPSEFRTRKTADLLRILAVHAGEAISADRLLDLLWPNVEPERGSASLRTAASQVRRALRHDCIERVFGGLVLRDAWVDCHAFLALVHQCGQATADGRFEEAVAAARQADALYLDDLEVSPDELQDWSSAAQEKLRKARTTSLAEAATAAVSLGWMRDATDFAERTLAADPYSETACRAAMLAYAGLGEVQQAVDTYLRFRERLVEELGVDPSSQTQAVYQQVLNSEPPQESVPPFVAYENQINHLRGCVAEMAARRGGVLVIAGPRGSGTTRLLAEYEKTGDMPLRRLSIANADAVVAADIPVGAVVVIDNVDRWKPGELRRLAELSQAWPQPQVVMVTYFTGLSKSADAEVQALNAAGLVELVLLPTLSTSQVRELTHALISGPPTDELVERLVDMSGGLPGVVVTNVRTWLSLGRLVHTGRGLDLGAGVGSGAGSFTARRSLRSLHERLTQLELGVLDVVAAVGTGISSAALAAVLSPDGTAHEPLTQSDAARMLSKMEDMAILSADTAGRFTFRDPMLRDATLAWLRPSARRRLHRNLIERLSLPAGARVTHWLEAREPRLACAAALEGAAEAMAEHRYAEARAHLHQVTDLIDEETAAPEDRLDLLLRLAACAQQLGLSEEDDRASKAARAIATKFGLTLPTEDQDESPRTAVTVLRRSRANFREHLGVSQTAAPTTEVETLLRFALDDAERRCDELEAAEARLLLAGLVCVPRRRFAEAQRLIDLARSRSPVTEQQALAVVTANESKVLLGDALYDMAAFGLAREASPEVCGLTSGLPVGMLWALGCHDRGEPDAARILDAAITEAESMQLEGPWRWVAARMFVEQGDLDRAREVSAVRQAHQGSPMTQILNLFGRAELTQALGNPDVAANMLVRAIELAGRSGVTLLLPELAARLVMLVGDDPQAAIDYLDLGEAALGEAAMGRERVALMLARAALRAFAGRPLAAAEVSGYAADLATTLGLTHCAAQARARRAEYLASVGRGQPPEAAANGEALNRRALRNAKNGSPEGSRPARRPAQAR